MSSRGRHKHRGKLDLDQKKQLEIEKIERKYEKIARKKERKLSKTERHADDDEEEGERFRLIAKWLQKTV